MNQQIRPQDIQAQDLPQQIVTAEKFDDGIVLTPEQLRSRRARNIAIGLALAFFALLFYAVTIAKLINFGPAFLNQPIG